MKEIEADNKDDKNNRHNFFIKFAAMLGGWLRTHLVELEAKDVKIKVQARQYMWWN